ncbi:hypothetical protein [Paenarthrobacter sp. 2TAF44]|uniref:hypothetical protein n=1 Tax=Paenarthrobacter sp. 2TAF44 TaxID=3233018 RepID=UPI003F9804E8
MGTIGIYLGTILSLHSVSPSNPGPSSWNVGHHGPSGRIVAHPWAGWFIEDSADAEPETDIVA